MDPCVDPQTGLIYLRARYYDPSTGQFLTRDPVEALTRQPYKYASDNPLNAIDPTGLCSVFSLSCDANAVGGALNSAANTAGRVLNAAGGYVSSHTGAVVGTLGDVATIAGCVTPVVDAGCAGYVIANAALQDVIIATGSGSFTHKVGLIGVVTIGFGGLGGVGASVPRLAENVPRYITAFLAAGGAAGPSLYDLKGLLECP